MSAVDDHLVPMDKDLLDSQFGQHWTSVFAYHNEETSMDSDCDLESESDSGTAFKLSWLASTSYHHWTKVPSSALCILEGLCYWLRTQKLPSDDFIRNYPYPLQWGLHRETKPLACGMAVDLYDLAWRTQSPKLLNATMKFLFSYYKNTRSVPSSSLVSRVFILPRDEYPLQRFFIDIRYKWDTSTHFSPHQGLSKSFLEGIMSLRSIRNAQFADKEKEDNLVLKLSDYHMYGSEKFDMYVIS